MRRQLRAAASRLPLRRSAGPAAPPVHERREAQAKPAEPPLIAWPLDHYYSPVPDHRVLSREPARSRVWPATPHPTPEIDWRADEQVELLHELARLAEFELPAGPTGDPREYHADNAQFPRLDAWMLQALLRHIRPRQMIEVGCGWSSLLTARVNREQLSGRLRLTCIEPRPPEFLGEGIEGISELLASPVEDLPVDLFLKLEGGDILFIDSTHTVKTGGDLTFLFHQVIPRLAPGVIVHIHDIFWPWDYPQDWVFEGRAWNEQYLVRAFLAFNDAFRIRLAVHWLTHCRPEVLTVTVPHYPEMYPDSGGSLWIQRT